MNQQVAFDLFLLLALIAALWTGWTVRGWRSHPMEWIEGYIGTWHLRFRGHGGIFCGKSSPVMATTWPVYLWKPIERCSTCIAVASERLGIR